MPQAHARVIALGIRPARAALFDIVNVQKLDGVRATASLAGCEAGAPSVCLFFRLA
jgi:hypothetical protein